MVDSNINLYVDEDTCLCQRCEEILSISELTDDGLCEKCNRLMLILTSLSKEPVQ
jgi:hypothetical protein